MTESLQKRPAAAASVLRGRSSSSSTNQQVRYKTPSLPREFGNILIPYSDELHSFVQEEFYFLLIIFCQIIFISSVLQTEKENFTKT